MIQQELYNIMTSIIGRWVLYGKIGSFEEEEIWRNAASQFRLPYWDWARKQGYAKNFAIPEICTLETIDIIMPGDQKQRNYPNPLVGFRDPMNVAMGDPNMMENAIQDDPIKPVKGVETLPWSKCFATSRYGILADEPASKWINGVNNWQECNGAMAEPPYRMFSPGYFDPWETFTSTIHNDSGKTTDFLSIEYVHNVIHNATGGLYTSEKDAKGQPGYEGLGLGHMSDVPVAAFDPIFWFHYCNIDRLTAIWQTLNPNMWFDKPRDGDPTPDSPLLPIHYDTKKTRWFSDKCRDWTKLNYQYDDLVPPPKAINPDGSINQTRYLQYLRSHINGLYPSTSQIVKATLGYTLDDSKFNDYVINVVYDRYALNGRAYAILFFISRPLQALSTYRQHDSFVGMVYTFSAPIETGDGSTGCGNCAQQKSTKVLSTAHIPITLPLPARARAKPEQGIPHVGIPGLGLGALDSEPMEELLRQQLRWEFVELGGRRRDAAEFPNTEIGVLHGQGSHGLASYEMPTYGGYKKLRRATQDKRLGSGHPDTRSDLIRDDPE